AIGPEGGELTLCGGFLRVPPGALEEAVTFGIEPGGALPAPAPPRALAGPALRFTPDDRLLPASVEIGLPHGGGEARFELWAAVDDELVGVEACEVTETTIGQSLALLGTFVATRDDYPYPESTDELGAGTAMTSMDDRDESWTLPADGFAMDQAYPGEEVALQLVLERTSEDVGFQQVRLDAHVSGGEGEVLHAQWYVSGTGTIWSLGTPEAPGTTGVLAIDEVDGERLSGRASGTLYAGEQTIPFAIDFDVTPEFYTFPPERVCEIPEG
ncbi:MAG TPA: hypothetical protein VFU21_26680, partial [Kofleriaceae bacterium]|nr:hypothetical protein [Kofleriaceae bacterium]